ncbi:class I SAM-dependent methyltransferase [Coleofasciculus sp. LEGE 07092]|nr:class I SAM-dependent methyltransferase [Coleofasciculus sp. LEGE 07081]MBE9129602.1 class I SAM-dependent methyltransferase [Coleofasciculus sp. LEGE 07081]MBE9151354.1 class I SAM-dependent methyltransferase [Coleofasciculus sp. LEGE 07092]
MTRADEVWKTEQLAKTFLEGVRGAIPLATEQIEFMLRVIQKVRPQVRRFLDLGCGNGILGRAIHTKYPDAKGVLLDFSESMIKAAKNQQVDKLENLDFIVQDFGVKSWVDCFREQDAFDVIVSGFAIHHQPDERKKEIYQEIYGLLQPGGLFINLEHVSSNSKLLEEAFEELMIDSLYAFHRRQGSQQSKEEIAQEYYKRPDKSANILAPIETQCDWLRELGFTQVDCYMKVFELALFGGVRPE